MIQGMHHHGLCLLRALVLVLALGGTGPALAATSSDKALAKKYFKQGTAAFELSKFAEALAAYEKAYKFSPLPGFLFNIGQCHRNLGKNENAIFSFRLYLQKKPDAQNRRAVEDLIQELEIKQEKIRAERNKKEQEKQLTIARLKQEEARKRQQNQRLAQQLLLPPVTPSQKSTLSPAPIYRRWWFWTGISVLALGGAAVGTYFALRPGEAKVPPSGFPVVLDFSR